MEFKRGEGWGGRLFHAKFLPKQVVNDGKSKQVVIASSRRSLVVKVLIFPLKKKLPCSTSILFIVHLHQNYTEREDVTVC
ncbi:MAG: hypothetical protein ACI8PB_003870 [Desulforhopalus sp.]